MNISRVLLVCLGKNHEHTGIPIMPNDVPRSLVFFLFQKNENIGLPYCCRVKFDTMNR